MRERTKEKYWRREAHQWQMKEEMAEDADHHSVKESQEFIHTRDCLLKDRESRIMTYN
jgi:hypothetical protein